MTSYRYIAKFTDVMNLRTARRLKDITQAQLASQSGVDQRTISDLERGANRNPSWDTVAKIAKALGVEPAEIFPVPEVPPQNAHADSQR